MEAHVSSIDFHKHHKFQTKMFSASKRDILCVARRGLKIHADD